MYAARGIIITFLTLEHVKVDCMSARRKQEVKCNIRLPVDRGLSFGAEFREARSTTTKKLRKLEPGNVMTRRNVTHDKYWEVRFC